MIIMYSHTLNIIDSQIVSINNVISVMVEYKKIYIVCYTMLQLNVSMNFDINLMNQIVSIKITNVCITSILL